MGKIRVWLDFCVVVGAGLQVLTEDSSLRIVTVGSLLMT